MIRKKLILYLIIICLLIMNTGSQADFSDSSFQEIVYPTVISREEVRRRRSVPDIDDSDSIYISISNWTLKTKVNKGLIIPPEFAIELIHSNKLESQKSKLSINCEPRSGSVEGTINSLVVLTICEGEFYGLMLAENRNLFIKPLMAGKHLLYEDQNLGWKTIKEDNDFVNLFRTSSSDEDNNFNKRRLKRATQTEQSVYNLTGDTFDIESENKDTVTKIDDQENLEIEEDKKQTEEDDSEDVGYFFDKTWEWDKLPKRKTVHKISPPRWIELGIAADYSVVGFHGTRIQHYILSLLNIIRHGNARKSLENVNKWHQKLLSSSEEMDDVAVWLTRLDIGGPSGYAPVSGACDPARSCALNRDEGLTSAFIIAHEVAHILGLTHDGDMGSGNSCGEEASHGSVMAPMVAATFHRFHWSACSRKEFHRRAKQWSCLLNKPEEENATHLKEVSQTAFTMDEQCRMEFGEGYQLCRSFDLLEPCSHLWCGKLNVSKICKTKKGPPLEGTECGENKWCINGFCDFVDRKKFDLGPIIYNDRNGSWGNWSDWGKCSTSCGIGVQFRKRKCNEPLPIYGGSHCKGEYEEFRVCEQEQCLVTVDLRLQQCYRLPSLIRFEEKLFDFDTTWLPYEPDEEDLKCQLICRSKETASIYYSKLNLIDGTPCSYGSSNICVQGKCYPMGCDKVLNSEKIEDSCGVCGGDNSTCQNITNKFQRKLRRIVTRLAVIPFLAYNIRVDVTIAKELLSYNGDLNIVIRDGRRHKNEISDFDFRDRNQVLVVEGAAFRPQKINETYTMWARGPVFSEIVVTLVVPDFAIKKGLFISAFSRYVINRTYQRKKSKYVWLSGGWGPCSTTCGIGSRHKTLACKDEESGKIVHRRKCPISSKPAPEIEKCNPFSCDFKWLTGPWEGCTRTCGNNGLQRRQLYCVYSSFLGSQVTKDNELNVYNVMLSPDKCKMYEEPSSERECNRIPCQGQWVYSDWSPCSQSCGIGIQSQVARCVPLAGESLSSCNGTFLPDKMRLCRGSGKRNPNCAHYCQKDKSQNCGLRNLRRYCQIPEFRRKCCRSCQESNN
ncbi:A disintegrin and metalloproteinase with thrombospondin motifs 3-like isoform X3 [Belonocnema kinseyi]|uniref:A disintegrin and metalloproteinase with thrombospondin motifs 3-like isoform X3 n=1 Tax=Belonocnema kinseyi TaxID=2817044 RepID=UPI00143CDFA6|nr:A disintegrin and metalloproteinase with thrombospondin motifs 3-like isoform X3 [Belonocnema kinseyi]